MSADNYTMGDVFRAVREDKRDRHAKLRAEAAQALGAAGVHFTSCNGGAHLRVTAPDRVYDFWPATGLVGDSGKTRRLGLAGLWRLLGRTP